MTAKADTMTRIRNTLCALLSASLGFALAEAAPSALAQAYPSKPIRLINPFAPGGTGEIVFRMLAPSIEEQLGQKVVLESRAGAAGNIGADVVANSPPDGYTLVIGTTNMFAINQFVFANMRFDPLKAFAPITILADVPSVFYVHPSVPANTLRELVSWIRSNPGKVNFASPGKGTTPHLNVELLAQMDKLELVHVPYKGLQPAMAAVIANEVQLYLAGFGAGRGHLQSGRLKAVAVGSRERLPALPGVATAIENGYKDFVASNWFALAAPAGTAPEIVERWAAVARRALEQPEIKKRFGELGLVPGGNSPAEAASQMAREAKLWQQVIKTAGIEAQ